MGTHDTYIWTNHARDKMRYYRLTESRIKRIIRHPARVEEGILEGAVACMQVAETKQYSEIWAMYVLISAQEKAQGKTQEENATPKKFEIPEKFRQILAPRQGKIKIITAWRYPGKSPERDPVPLEVLREIRNIL